MKKFICYLHTDGLRNTSFYVLRKILEYVCVKKSFTFFYRYNALDKFEINIPKNLCFKVISNYEELNKYNYCKFKYLDAKTWFYNGSYCCLCLNSNNVIAYIWAHRKFYTIKNIGKFILFSNEIWIGTSFCDKKFRRKSINTLLRKYLINHLLNESNFTIFGSANLNNIPSIANLLKFGYRIIGVVHEKRFFNRTIYLSCAGKTIEKRVKELL